MKHILVAADFSDRSRLALQRAALLAKAHGARLTLCHSDNGTLSGAYAEKHRRMMEELQSDFLREVEPLLDVEYESHIVSGPPWQALLRESEALNADLLVLGRHQENAWKEVFRGTTVDRVVRQTHIPVLIVASNEVTDYRHVLVGMDFSAAAKQALRTAKNWVPDADMEVIHVSEKPDSGVHRGRTDEELKEMLRSVVGEEIANAKARLTVETGWPYRVFSQTVKNDGTKLLVLGIHASTGFTSVVVGGEVENCLATPFCDTLLVPS